MRWSLPLLVLATPLAACGGEDGAGAESVAFSLTTTSEECGVCHPVHYDEWRGSMHAYATQDPIFLAMNMLALEDTDGAADQFCVDCHAPVASRQGLTPVSEPDDGWTMATPDDPAFNDGVQCVSCHAVATVEETHNAKFTLSDEVYAGVGASDAAKAAHPIKANAVMRSGELCGSCHDVVNGFGVPIENTYTEWYERYEGRTAYDLTCNSCHMSKYEGAVAVGGPEDAEVHRHTFVGVDQALSGEFPNKEEQAKAVAGLLSSAASVSIMSLGAAGDLRGYRVTVKNGGTGHALPSGTAAERRVWVHFVATDEAGNVLKESGMLDPNGNVMDRHPDHSLTPDGDPDLLWFGQRLLGPDDKVVPFSWQAASFVPFMLEPGEEGHGDYEVDVAGVEGAEITVTATLKYRAFQPYFIAELVVSGHLAEGAVEPSPIYDMASKTKKFSIR